MQFFKRFIRAISTSLINREFQGFIEGHTFLDKNQEKIIEQLLDSPDSSLITDFEKAFATIVGDGECISFAAGRMAFFCLLDCQGIGAGDEVILTGFTCSVMADAVIKTGAVPVYADIDPDTYGTSAASVQNCLSDRTKMIVAQHSFGIPCDIESIADIAATNHIFLLEDCAISLASKVHGTVLGNFGDAALFSTDHSKPVNTFTGGLLFSRNSNLIKEIRRKRDVCDDLPDDKLQAIWKRILVEKRFCNHYHYSELPLYECIRSLVRRLPWLVTTSPYLDEDQNLTGSTSYPYPARFPSFLAYLGILELDKWHVTANRRKASLESFIHKAEALKIKKYLPAAYFETKNEIIPLRLVWSQPDGKKVREALSGIIDPVQTWFQSPIISTNTPLSDFGYQEGSCPVAETIAQEILNIPVNLTDKAARILFKNIAVRGESVK